MAHRGAGDDLPFALGQRSVPRDPDLVVVSEQESLAVVIEPVDERPLTTHHRSPERAGALGIEPAQLAARAIHALRSAREIMARRNGPGGPMLEPSERVEHSQRGVGRGLLLPAP